MKVRYDGPVAASFAGPPYGLAEPGQEFEVSDEDGAELLRDSNWHEVKPKREAPKAEAPKTATSSKKGG